MNERFCFPEHVQGGSTILKAIAGNNVCHQHLFGNLHGSTCLHLDDTTLLQLLQLLAGETKQLTIDLFVVRTQGGAKLLRFSRCLTELGHNPRKTNDGALTWFDTDLVLLKHGARTEMGIVHDV